MDERDQLALHILREALDTLPTERDGFVSQRCGTDRALRERVDSLLRRVGGAEPGEPSAAQDTAEATHDLLLDTRLGPFRIVERIGRGGMGVVYRGLREDADFAQEVALKLIRRGFDFDDIRARFLRERRILARLDHPHLARFIDGGVADDGRPWFALEFVRGESITRWCDVHCLCVRDRVRLFLDVCAAVQYAHAQLVVHRDLKPDNILVDEAGRVRLLDFGIARLLESEEAGTVPTTLHSRGAFTPEYAAPEQFSGEVAGVATDVYALGVVLYRLVCGALPHELDRHDIAAAGRTLRERPPQALAQAIARDGPPATRQRLAARATSLRGFRKDTRGDLTRILGKALAHEPQRRYPSVQAFADDLLRWLDGIPVRVSGNAFGYRFAKFVGRNRVAVAFGVLAGLAIAAGLAASIWQAREARLQRDAALAEAKRSEGVRNYLMLMFRDAASQRDSAVVNVRELLKASAERLFSEFSEQPHVGRTTALMMSDLFLQLGDAEGAAPLLERLLRWPGIEDDPKLLANARYNLAQIEQVRGHTARARELLEQAQAYWMKHPETSAELLNESRSTQARIERTEGRIGQAIETLRTAAAERRRLLGKADFEYGSLLNTLSVSLAQAGRFDEAGAIASESYDVFERLGMADSDGGMAALNSRANAAFMSERVDESVRDYRRVAEATRALYGETIKLGAALNNLGAVLTHLGRHEESQPLLEDALRIIVAQAGENSPPAVTSRVSLAELYARIGRTREAERLAQAAVEIAETRYASRPALLGSTYRARARVRLAQQRLDEARADVERATAQYLALEEGGQPHIRMMAGLRAELGMP